MTEREKAAQIIHKMAHAQVATADATEFEVIEAAKKCAGLAVQTTISVVEKWDSIPVNELIYWRNVLDEIKKYTA